MKRLLAGLCAAALLAGSAAAVQQPVDEMAAPPEPDAVQETVTVDYTSAADALYALGLFQGRSVGKDGKPVYDLAAPCTRAEAAVMLVRLLGKEEEAKTAGSTPFTDLADWQKPYVGWLYQRGLAAGASYTTFEPDARCTAQMYATFMLRALGYSDQKNDFTYINALRFAAQVGLIDLFSCDTDDFRRDDAVQMSRMALTMTRKGEREDLLASLTAAGAVDADRAAAFRQTAQPDADLQAALAKRKPYTAKVFAALQAGGDSMSLTGTLHTDGERTLLEGMLSAAINGGRAASKQVRIVRNADGVSISDLTGTVYRDDQLARLLRESGVLDLVTAELPAASLRTGASRTGSDFTISLVGGGEATVSLDAAGQPALRTLSMRLHGAAYEITVETEDAGAVGRVNLPDLTGFIKLHAFR